MTHKIIRKEGLQHPYVLLEVQLFAENESEKEAIKMLELLQGNELQNELITNYLLFGLGSLYSVISIEQQRNNVFILKGIRN